MSWREASALKGIALAISKQELETTAEVLRRLREYFESKHWLEHLEATGNA